MQQAAIVQHQSVRHNGDDSRRPASLSLLITGHFGDSASDSAGQAAQVGGIPSKASDMPPLLMTDDWSGTNKINDLEPLLWISNWACEMEGGREMVWEQEPLLLPNPSYWFLWVFITLYYCTTCGCRTNKSTPANCTQNPPQSRAHWDTAEGIFLAEALILLLTVI